MKKKPKAYPNTKAEILIEKCLLPKSFQEL